MAKQKKSASTKAPNSQYTEDELADLNEVSKEEVVEEKEYRQWNGVPILALPKTFYHTKIKRTQVWRSENVAIYAIHSFYNPEKITGHEVFRIMKMPKRNIMGKEYPPAEKVPNDEKWGIYGFDCGMDVEEIKRERVPQLEALKYNGPKWKD